MPFARGARRDQLVRDLDIKRVGIDTEPPRDAVAGHRRGLALLACLRADLELRNADEEPVPIGFDLRAVHGSLPADDRLPPLSTRSIAALGQSLTALDLAPLGVPGHGVTPPLTPGQPVARVANVDPAMSGGRSAMDGMSAAYQW